MIMPIIVGTIELLNLSTFEYISQFILIFLIINFLNLHFERIKVQSYLFITIKENILVSFGRGRLKK